MSELQVINTLNTKADGLRSHIVRLERDLEETKAALSHVLATIHMFRPPRTGEEFPAHYNMAQLFKRREIVGYCTEALQAGPMDTRGLADWIIERKEFPDPDRHLKTSVAFRVVQALRLQERRGGRIKRIGKVSNVVVWKLDAPPLTGGVGDITGAAHTPADPDIGA